MAGDVFSEMFQSQSVQSVRTISKWRQLCNVFIPLAVATVLMNINYDAPDNSD